MRLRVLPLLALGLAGCLLDLQDPAGRACDEAHPCAGGRVCVLGVCAAPDGEDAGGAPCVEGAPCAVGLGECRREGATVCAPTAVCSVQAGTPAPEVCDGLDNDCDGRVDVSIETELVALSAGSVRALQWVSSGDGFAAVYARDDGATPRVHFQRYAADLSRVGAEVRLSESGSIAGRTPALRLRAGGFVAAWSERSSGGTARVAVSFLDAQGEPVPLTQSDGGLAPRHRYFNEEATHPVRLAVSQDGQYVFAAWIDQNGRLRIAVVRADGGLFRAPGTLLDPALGDGGTQTLLEASISQVGQNDVMFGALVSEGGQTLVKVQRVLETLSLTSPSGVLTAESGARDLTLVTPLVSGGGATSTVAAAWLQGVGSMGLRATSAVLSSAPATVMPPVPGDGWRLSGVAQQGGPMVAWVETDSGKVQAHRLGGAVRDISPLPVSGRSYPTSEPVSLAAADGGFGSVAYAVSQPGQGIQWYGQRFCAP